MGPAKLPSGVREALNQMELMVSFPKRAPERKSLKPDGPIVFLGELEHVITTGVDAPWRNSRIKAEAFSSLEKHTSRQARFPHPPTHPSFLWRALPDRFVKCEGFILLFFHLRRVPTGTAKLPCGVRIRNETSHQIGVKTFGSRF